jgi:hypothetical protein
MKTSKTIFLLNIGDYAPEITALTYPFLRIYAEKIGANIYEITQRKYSEFPVTYEKIQIFSLAKEIGSEWNIYIDSDALIHPECIDFTSYIPKDTVAHHSNDIAGIRWTLDSVFMRDGRFIGSGNWFTIASHWCLDLWHPLDISLDEAIRNIHPTQKELTAGIKPEHLIDDYTLSRNISRFGLKFKPLHEIWKSVGMNIPYQHQYTVSKKEKLKILKEAYNTWDLGIYLR